MFLYQIEISSLFLNLEAKHCKHNKTAEICYIFNRKQTITPAIYHNTMTLRKEGIQNE